MATEAQVAADLAAGRRYAVSNEDAYEAFCDAHGLAPYEGGEPEYAADTLWLELSDDERNEYVFPRSRGDLAD